MRTLTRLLTISIFALTTVTATTAQSGFSGLKADAVAGVDDRAKMVQEIVDSLFSFSELGFQEFETQRYLTAILEANGFSVEAGVAGIPSALSLIHI